MDLTATNLCVCTHARESHNEITNMVADPATGMMMSRKTIWTNCNDVHCQCKRFKATLFCQCGHTLDAHTYDVEPGKVPYQAQCSARDCVCEQFFHPIASVGAMEVEAVAEAEAIMKGKKK